MSEVLEKHRDVWERLAKGYTVKDLEIAAILRSIVREIEGSTPADWTDILAALRWCEAYAEKELGFSPWSNLVRYDETANTSSPDIEYIVVQ